MKHYIKTVTWKFQDSAVEYPQLKNNRIKITAPIQLYEQFRFYLMEKFGSGLLYSGSLAAM